MAHAKVQKAELVGLKLIRVSESIRGASEGLFKRSGLSSPQYNVLRILRGAGEDALSCQEISDRMLHRVPDITRLLDRLVGKGLVDRRRSESDRRVVRSRITGNGLDLLAAIDGPLQAQVKRQFALLKAAELEKLDVLLDMVAAGTAGETGSREHHGKDG
jgi:DNA-binding MarR family transcriptional regulator